MAVIDQTTNHSHILVSGAEVRALGESYWLAKPHAFTGLQNKSNNYCLDNFKNPLSNRTRILSMRST